MQKDVIFALCMPMFLTPRSSLGWIEVSGQDYAHWQVGKFEVHDSMLFIAGSFLPDNRNLGFPLLPRSTGHSAGFDSFHTRFMHHRIGLQSCLQSSASGITAASRSYPEIHAAPGLHPRQEGSCQMQDHLWLRQQYT